ncbi:MAG: hypothetical protein J7M29_08675, partial [Verrucomicrobia bacterium]|nr:hypothetical protein [Verrucomicrobiota bacterium]
MTERTHMTDAHELLQKYARDGSEAAFEELVRRYVNLVYSVALRRTGGDAHLAKDVVQKVFLDLARRARRGIPGLERDPARLGGWLHRRACMAASDAVRSERRRRRREARAVEMKTMNAPERSEWETLAPELDEAVNSLEAKER